MSLRPARFCLMLLLSGCACASSSIDLERAVPLAMSLRAIPEGCSIPQDTQAQIVWFQCDDGREGYLVAGVE